MSDTEVCIIAEPAFWSQWTGTSPGIDTRLLNKAIRLGRAGEKSRAYRQLAEWHRHAHQERFAGFLETHDRLPAITAGECKALSNAWKKAHTPSARCRCTGQTMDAGFRLAVSLARSGNPETASLLRQLVHGLYNFRKQGVFSRYPLGTQLGLHNHFMTLWSAYHALAHAGHLDPATAEQALKLMIGITRKVRIKAEHYIVHNIYTAGCYGIFMAARHLPDWRESPAWDRFALERMALDFKRSFFKDGAHIERNWGYGAHTIRRLTEVYQFGMQTGGLHGLERAFRDGLRKAYQYYAYTMGPNDFCPGFGDEGLRPFGDIFDKALTSGVFTKGTSRDLGVDRSRSYWMRPSGVAILRNGAHRDATYANLNLGDYAGWHSHQDLLSMNVWAGGRVLLEEVVRFGMYEHPMDVLWRCDRAHNQVLVDGFFYDSRPIAAEDTVWHSDARIDYVSAVHRAYRSLPLHDGFRPYHPSANLVVRRTVVLVKNPGYLLVLDSVRNDDQPTFNRATSQHWHSPLPFRITEPGRVVLGKTGGCVMAWARPDRIRRMEPTDDFLPGETATTVHSPVFRHWHALQVRTWMPETAPESHIGFATVIVPWQKRIPAVAIRDISPAGWTPWREGRFEIRTPAGTDRITLNPERRSLSGETRCRAHVILDNGRGSVRVPERKGG